MNISLGNFGYDIKVTDEQLFLNRKAVMAICDHPRRELLVSRDATSSQMRQIIGEAVSRIWSYRFPELNADELNDERTGDQREHRWDRQL